jgi:hypothetical protein
MAVILRLLAICLAYVLACATAAIVLAVGTFALGWNDFSSNALESVVLWTGIIVTTIIIVALAVLPMLLVVVLAEWLAWRSILIYPALGGALAMLLVYGLDFTASVADTFVRERQVVAAAGIAGGLVYWLIAGRKAGAWKAGA